MSKTLDLGIKKKSNKNIKKICLILGSSPKFLGGMSLYQRNLIHGNMNKNLNFTWIYPGDKNREYNLDGIKCIEIKVIGSPILREFDFGKKARNLIISKDFDIINTHANWGFCLKSYRKIHNQKIIHTYHGTTYPYMKIQFKRFGFFRYLFYPFLPFIYLLEKVPMKKADAIICVSEKVRKEIEDLYGKRNNVFVLRTGVNTKKFKKLNKAKARKKLSLDIMKIYGLYSGRGGYWNKGLDRAIKLGEQIYKQENDFRLLVIGADKNKCKKYLNYPFVEYRGLINREDLLKYYSASDFFLSLSRYEGGAPTLAVSESMASECLVVCSKDSIPEILKHKEDCLMLKDYGENEATLILTTLKDGEKINKMNELARKKIDKLSLNGWARRYLEILLK